MSGHPRGTGVPKCPYTLRIAGAAALTMLLATSITPAQTAGRPALHLRERQRIAGADHDLSVVAVVAVAADGTVWISQPQDGNLVAFNRSGMRVAEAGGRGEGPGRFAEPPASLRADADGVWALDRMLRRMTRFGSDGAVLETRKIEWPAGVPVGGSSIVAAGPELVYFSSPARPVPIEELGSKEPRRVKLWASKYDGTDVRQIASYDYPVCAVTARSEHGRFGVSVPFCNRVRVAISPNTERIAIVTPLTDRDDITGVHVQLYDGQGRRLSDSRHLLGPSPLSARSQDSAIARLRDRVRGNAPELVDAILREELMPHTIPPVYDLLVSDEGITWITTRTGQAGRHGLLGVDPTGHEIGYMSLPETSWVRWAGQGIIAIREEDPDGLQDVVLYSVTAR